MIARGNTTNPMTDGQLERFASLADPVVGPAQAAVIARTIDQLLPRRLGRTARRLVAARSRSVVGRGQGMIVSPPLTISVTPVMYRESGPTRNTTVRPMSASASPSRSIGRMATLASRRSGWASKYSSAAADVACGEIALTRISNGAPLVGGHLRQPADVLAGGVPGEPGETVGARRRHDVDDRSAVLAVAVRTRARYEPEGTPQPGADRQVEVGVGVLGERHAVAHRLGAVHQRVETPVRGERGVDGAVGEVGIPDVAGHGEARRAQLRQLRDGLVGGLRIAVNDGDVHALACEGAGDPAPDALAATRHHADPTRQRSMHRDQQSISDRKARR